MRCPHSQGPNTSCDDHQSIRAPQLEPRGQVQPWEHLGCTHACAYTLTCTVCPRQSPSGAKINMPGVQNDSPSLAAMSFLEQVATGRPGGPESGRHEKGQVPAHPAAPWWPAAAAAGGGSPIPEPHGGSNPSTDLRHVTLLL